jgi:hypothetical protein
VRHGERRKVSVVMGPEAADPTGGEARVSHVVEHQTARRSTGVGRTVRCTSHIRLALKQPGLRCWLCGVP